MMSSAFASSIPSVCCIGRSGGGGGGNKEESSAPDFEIVNWSVISPAPSSLL